MTRGKTIGVGALVTVAFVIAIALAGADRGKALYVYVLTLSALGLALLRAQINAAMPVVMPLERRLQQAPPAEERVMQLEALSSRISSAESSTFDLHYRLRPLLREIAAARLARRHGVDLDRQPERSRALAGDELWELIRPDRNPPEERFAKGISNARIDELIDHLEAI